MEIVLFLALFLAVPSLLYVGGRIAGRGVWGLVLARYEKRGAGAYRAVDVPIWVPGKAPIVVKLAAITSFLLGQMVVPGALAALAGLVVSLEMLGRPVEAMQPVIFVLTLSAPTGLYVAGGLLAAGILLLRRDPNAAAQSRAVARFSIVHNVVLILALLAASRFGDGAVLACIAYALVSIGQAALLLAAARALDARARADAHTAATAHAPVV